VVEEWKLREITSRAFQLSIFGNGNFLVVLRPADSSIQNMVVYELNHSLKIYIPYKNQIFKLNLISQKREIIAHL
jgi:hypothetical protein